MLSACRVRAITQYLLDKLPGAKVALLGLLPRGRNGHTQPSMFSAAIDKANQQLK